MHLVSAFAPSVFNQGVCRSRGAAGLVLQGEGDERTNLLVMHGSGMIAEKFRLGLPKAKFSAQRRCACPRETEGRE